ncbi:MAG: BBP7 family outer membrane beta-barrel protein [Fimbriiglobus sp.]
MTSLRAKVLILATLALPAWAVGEEPIWRDRGPEPLPVKPVTPPPAPVLPVATPAPVPPAPLAPSWEPKPEAGPKWQPVAPPAPVAPPMPETVPVTPVEAPFRPEDAPKPRETTQPLPAPKELPKLPTEPTAPAPAPPTTTTLPMLLTPPGPTPQEVWGGLGAGERELEPWPGAVKTAGHHGVFGSPNITLSRDHSIFDLFGTGLFSEDNNTILPGESPLAEGAYIRAEYLLWWVQAGKIPVLATTARDQTFGYLGTPGTQILLGPGNFGNTARNGFRLRGGLWCDPCQPCTGVDGSFFFLGRQTTAFQIDSNQFPTIARPIFAPNFNSEFGELVAFPGLSTGALRVETTSFLWGADLNHRWALCQRCDSRSEIFAGYRHVNLSEGLTITEFINAGPNAPDPAGTSIVVQDDFQTRNRFHGAQVGYAFTRRAGRFEWDSRISVALGVNSQQVNINGFQNRNRPGQPAEVFSGGLLAAGPNLGSFSRERFSVVPEAMFNIGYLIGPRFKATVGYNFLFWSNVIRPGEQIDRVVDLTFVPNAPRVPFGQNRPLPTFDQSNMWVQGLQFGLEYRW